MYVYTSWYLRESDNALTDAPPVTPVIRLLTKKKIQMTKFRTYKDQGIQTNWFTRLQIALQFVCQIVDKSHKY